MHDVTNRISQFIHEKNSDFTGVVYLAQGDTVLFHEGYGCADRANELPNNPDTKFGIASGTKTLTATAVCQLIEQGKLSLDTKLLSILDYDFPHFSPDVTVKHLLTHTSGVPDYFDESVMDDFEALWKDLPVYSITKPAHLLPLFADQKQTFDPGSQFAYNNGGYVLLGLIIEKVTGRSFSDYIMENIVNKIGMTNTGFYRMDMLPANTALGYIPLNEEETEWKTNIFSIPVVGMPDGGIFTTTGDWHKYWKALLGNKLLKPELTRELLSQQARSSETDYYGYGMWISTHKDGTLKNYYLVGGDPGVGFVSSYFPANDVLVTVCSNIEDGVWDVMGYVEGEIVKDL